MNNLTLIGNICNDLELKSTPSGKSVCSFNLAVKRPFAKDITDFFTIVCWNKQAENVCRYCGKGMKLGISGMLTSRSYQDRDGNNRTVYEVLANEVEFLEKKADRQTHTHSPAEGGRNVAPNYPDNTFGDGFVAFNDDDSLPF